MTYAHRCVASRLGNVSGCTDLYRPETCHSDEFDYTKTKTKAYART